MIGGGATDQFGGLHGMHGGSSARIREEFESAWTSAFRLAVFADEGLANYLRAWLGGLASGVLSRAARAWLCRCKGATLRSRCVLVAPAS